MSAPAHPLPCSVPAGWEGDPPASPPSLFSVIAEIHASEYLASSDPSSPSFPSSGSFTPPSDVSSSQPSLHEVLWPSAAEDSSQSDTDFWSQWINDGTGNTVVGSTTPNPVNTGVEPYCGETDLAFNPYLDSLPVPELAPSQCMSTLPVASVSHSTPAWCPPTPILPDFEPQPYSIPLNFAEIPTSSPLPNPAYHQNPQMPTVGSFEYYPSFVPAIPVTQSATITAQYTTPWTSRAFPRSSRASRDTSGRQAQMPFTPTSPRPRYLSRSFASCSRPSAHLISRCTSPEFNPAHHSAISRRGYASSTPLKRKRDGAGDKEDGKPAPPKRSELRPPKQAPSVWQIYFTDWLEQKKSHADGDKKLNVAQAAKEAGQLYNKLSDEQRDELKQRALVLKDKYDRECAAWKRTLTPDDIARENEFRAAQRRSGKSRRKNINDPNAPKRPLSAYFLFLQHIRADPMLVKDVFGEETETTRQSVLAAAKWRSLDDAEKKPYFEQAENAKLEYEADRKAYEDQVRQNEYSSVSSVVVYPTSSGLRGGEDGGGVLSASGGADS